MQLINDLSELDGLEISPGITIIGTASPTDNPEIMRCLANICGCLGLIEIRVKAVVNGQAN